MSESNRSGIVAFVGRPNAGKSTLMNRLLEDKIAIVSDKPQTTRHRLVGILTTDAGQMVFHDTPGVHRPLHRLNREMVHLAMESLRESDVSCLVVDASIPFGKGDAFLLERAKEATGARVLALNKIDHVRKPSLLPLIQQYAAAVDFAEIVPVSALTGEGCDELLASLWKLLPEGEPVYDSELVTIHPERFMATERIREKVLELTHGELPFTTAVVLDRWEEEEGRHLRLYVTILVDRPGQKAIVIGKGGAMIKAIGTRARHDLEELLERPVYLDLHVRVETDWRENRRVLASLERDLLASTTLEPASLEPSED